MTNKVLVGCEECNGEGQIYLYTRASYNGEPDEVIIPCKCTEE